MADNDEQYQAENTAFKHEDTTSMMKISFIGGNGYPIYPVKSHKFIAKVATADGTYVGDYPCSAVGNQFQIKSADLKGLASGSYKLEVWETYTDDDGKDQTGIFPSPSAFVGFTINKNIEDTAWDLVKEISFQDIVDKAVISSGQHLVVAATNTLASDLPASVTQEFKDGKNQLTFNIPRGVKGDKGDQGVQGIQGDKGDTGEPGPVGPKGDKGDTGPQGPQGDKGDTGPQGIQGNTGATGPQGPIGPAGKNFNIRKTFESVSAMEASKGAGFTDGDFTMIASNVSDPDNSKLYVWDGSKFVYISDLSGAQGIQGPQGIQGIQGIQGKQGLTGPQGPKGDKGDQGVQGIQGVKGDTGEPGPVGPKGDKGDTGPQGPQGDKGDTGSQGPQGVAGKDGHSVWYDTTNHGPNLGLQWFNDLVNASASNPPKVNDIMINAGGNMAMITEVNITNKTAQGGGTFNYGSWIGNIMGPKPVRGVDYWTDADKQSIIDEIKRYVDKIINH